jgi:acyl carrier protein
MIKIEKINSIIRNLFGKKINDDDDLIKKNILDSFNFLVLVTELEKQFKIKINLKNQNIRSFSTINKIHKFIEKKLKN